MSSPGLIKINDPKGTAYKLEEYFYVFSSDFGSIFELFVPVALPLAILLSVLEVALGIGLLLKYRPALVSHILLYLILFFTFLTFYSAAFDKVTDCGCFGDLLKLTPWQSFFKDVVLTILIVLLFRGRSEGQTSPPRFFPDDQLAITGVVVLVCLSVFSVRYLPFLDFSPYAVGNNLGELMEPSKPLIYTYIMEKDGKRVELDKYPQGDEFKFIEMKLLNPEDQPKITDLSIWNEQGDFTQELFEGEKLLFIVSSVETANKRGSRKLGNLLKGHNASAKVWTLTASPQSQYRSFGKEAGWDHPFYYADATVLKTMIRSNPGVMLLRDGIVEGKWSSHSLSDIPKPDEQ